MAALSKALERAKDRPPRVLYVQYTNPAAYPPLQHSASILAAAGCEVRLVGTAIAGERLTFEQSDRVRVALMPFEPGGWRQKVHYAQFASWVAAEARQWRPDWVYVSDPLACPAALALRRLTGARFIYHEHDSPSPDVGAQSTFMRVVLRARRALAAHSWPGNVRELKHTLEAAAALSDDGVIRPEQLDISSNASASLGEGDYHRQLEAFRRRLVERALQASEGSLAGAARQLGVTRQYLSQFVRKFGLEVKR